MLSAAQLPDAKQRISIFLSLHYLRRGAMLSALSIHSCARRMIWPMRRVCHARNGASNWIPGLQSGAVSQAEPIHQIRFFSAVRDAVERFAIPLSLLDELVAGVTMDLDHAASDTPDTYATFDDLYRYCYLVASVVGLVCIRIFGYQDRRAEKLAEKTGIAFQLTNILRDVAEDAERNRVYLPLEDLAAHSVALESLLQRIPGTPPAENERKLLACTPSETDAYLGRIIPQPLCFHCLIPSRPFPPVA